MVAFLNEFCPNWVYVKCKLHPYGNEYHTIACCISKIIFWIELVETQKDCPSKGPHSTPQFEDSMPKTAALCCQLTEPMWGTNRVCLLDSGFGYLQVVTELEKKGVKATTVLKKKGVGWPAGSDANNVLHHMQGKDVGYQTVCKASTQITLTQIFG